MIPKTIHYCWFGHNPKPKLAKKCIRSWKRYCKGYEIIEWNEDNFDISTAPLYVRQAYEAKKWAFVTDYVRLWAMVNYGGIYMDTDVQVIKPLDRFLQYEAVSGFESETKILTGLMACREGFPLFAELLHEYDNIPFVKEDGSFDLTTNIDRITKLCSRYGFIPNGQEQTIVGFTLFPKEYFCPKSWENGKTQITKNTRAIHHYAATWWSEERKKHQKASIRRQRRYAVYDAVVHFPNRLLSKLLGDTGYQRLKKVLKR